MVNLLTLVAFLFAQPPAKDADIPAGPGKEIVTKRCGGCHGLDAITAESRTERDWRKKVDKMIDRGAEVTDEEYQPIIKYLVANFGKKD